MPSFTRHGACRRSSLCPPFRRLASDHATLASGLYPRNVHPRLWRGQDPFTRNASWHAREHKDQGAGGRGGRPSKQTAIEALNAYLDGFHFYNGKMNAQMEAHHYCGVLNDEVIQCVIYDGNVKEAKLMGVEYIISGKLFNTLPEEEKPMWHSHVYEVKSGQLIAPGIPEIAEQALMKKLVSTYGKTWHTWHTDMHKQLPLGVPQLMMGFTTDGQADPDMIAARDKRFGIDSPKKKADRASIPAPAIDPAANGGMHGKIIQMADPRQGSGL